MIPYSGFDVSGGMLLSGNRNKLAGGSLTGHAVEVLFDNLLAT